MNFLKYKTIRYTVKKKIGFCGLFEKILKIIAPIFPAAK